MEHNFINLLRNGKGWDILIHILEEEPFFILQ